MPPRQSKRARVAWSPTPLPRLGDLVWLDDNALSDNDAELKVTEQTMLELTQQRLDEALQELNEHMAQNRAAGQRIDEYEQDLDTLVNRCNELERDNLQLQNKLETQVQLTAGCRQTGVELAQQLGAKKEQHDKILVRLMVATSQAAQQETPREVLLKPCECTLCHEVAPATIMLPCFHTACAACIGRWKEQSSELRCPSCRTPVQFTHCSKTSMTIRWTGQGAPCVTE